MFIKGLNENILTTDCNVQEVQICCENHDSTCLDEIADGPTQNLTLGSKIIKTIIPITCIDTVYKIILYAYIEMESQSDLKSMRKSKIDGKESDFAVMSPAQNQQETQIDYENFSDKDLLLNIHLLKGCEKTERTAIRSEIIPPPGAPKLENSARLRRYRHNVD